LGTNQHNLTITVSDIEAPDAFLRRIATLLGEVVAQKLRDLPADQPRLLLTVEEAADRLAISRTVVYELLRSGRLESVTIGRNRRIPAVAIDDFVARLRKEQHEHLD
jgi:excisionase family DNA binding protein